MPMLKNVTNVLCQFVLLESTQIIHKQTNCNFEKKKKYKSPMLFISILCNVIKTIIIFLVHPIYNKLIGGGGGCMQK